MRRQPFCCRALEGDERNGILFNLPLLSGKRAVQPDYERVQIGVGEILVSQERFEDPSEPGPCRFTGNFDDR
jgi:hypothetical protein